MYAIIRHMKNNIKDLKIEIKEASTFWQKFIGLQFKKKPISYGLLLKNTNGIHTFFMFQKIDVVLLDKDYNILKIYKSLKSWRIILPKRRVKHTLELPSSYSEKF